MAAIELRGVGKRYGDVAALRDVSFSVEAGEVFGFLGPNGAGKSTTIDVLLNFARPTAGSARVLGYDTEREGKQIRERTGVLPDGYGVFNHRTAREHVAYAVDARGADDEPLAVLDRVGLAGVADRLATDFSKGMRQRLVFGMALVGDPDLLLLDEPSTGLDPNGAGEMREIIRTENERGATVFFSSHILEQVEAVCDRVAILNRGEIVAVDSIDGLRDLVGADSKLTVHVDVVTEEMATSVAGLAGVTGVTSDDGRITLTCERRRMKPALDAVEDAGATIEGFEIAEASLEELFSELTTRGAA